MCDDKNIFISIFIFTYLLVVGLVLILRCEDVVICNQPKS